MRVIGGELRSREIPSPQGIAIRPTPGRVKEALFSMLGSRIDGARVLDLFAGTGAIGFEALSRGASHATFVESHRVSAEQIRATAARFGLAERATVVCAPVELAVRAQRRRFDFVYADPPYALAPPYAAFDDLRARGAIDSATIVVYEHRSDAAAFVRAGFVTSREAVYGEVALQFLMVEA